MPYRKEDIDKFSKFSIVHILPGPTPEGAICSSLHALKTNIIFLSSCVATKRPIAPADFPGHMVISVGSVQPYGQNEYVEETVNEAEKSLLPESAAAKPLLPKPLYKWQSYGSALDFVCQGFTGVQINNPFDASYYATAIAALVMLRAYNLGELYLKTKPYVMKIKRCLLHICRHLLQYLYIIFLSTISYLNNQNFHDLKILSRLQTLST